MTLVDELQAIPGYAAAERRALPSKAVALEIAGLRAELGLTQSEFAEKVGITKDVVQRLEEGRTLMLSTQVLGWIADAWDLEWSLSFKPRSSR